MTTGILIVEGAEADGNLAARLERQGHRVTKASDPESALAAARRDSPEMILLDSSIGVEACTRFLRGLEEEGAPLHLPVIVLAGSEERADDMRQWGAHEVLRRPETADELADKVRILLEVLRLRRELAARNAELQCLTSQLAHVLDMKNRFLDITSHDLRTPVTTIKLVHDILEGQLKDTATPGIQRLLDILSRNLAKIEARIEELLLIARLDVDDMRLQVGNLALNAVVEDAVASFFPGAISRGVDLDAVFSDIRPMRGDARRMGQLASELIACGLNRVDAGGRLMVETREANGGALIQVSDNGPELSEEKIEEMLAGLEDDNPTRQTRASLYAAYRIARRHGGRIDIQPSREGGAVFSAWLPFAPAVEGTGSEEATS